MSTPPEVVPPAPVLLDFVLDLGDAVFLVDGEWRPRWMNNAARTLASTLVRGNGAATPPDDVFLALLDHQTRARVVLDGGSIRTGASGWHAVGELAAGSEHPVRITVSLALHAETPGWRWIRLADLGVVRQLEARVREAQAMQGVAQLAIGTAHEFSDLITAITGSAETLAHELGASHPLRPDADVIRQAADHAAVLTRELGRAVASRASAPQLVDVARTIRAMEPTLRRTLGPQVRLRITHPVSNGTAPSGAEPAGAIRGAMARLDVSQLEHSVQQLVRNATEATDGDGDVSIVVDTFRNDAPLPAVHAILRPGRYIRITIADTGRGMDAPTLAHAFEPLFSTKGQRGLGLSLVFGTATQMGGYVTCESAPAQGTTVALYLPEVPDSAVRGEQSPLPSVLLVDDEEGVRHVAAHALRREGYRVSEARDADEALALVSVDPLIADVLVTDVRMPGLTGVDLAYCILAARPDVRVLFCSGCHAGPEDDDTRLPRGAAFLPKPFTPQALGARVRELLA